MNDDEQAEFTRAVMPLQLAAIAALDDPECDPTKESRLSPVPHGYVVVGEEYGSLGDGGSYEKLRCVRCGRVAYSQLPD